MKVQCPECGARYQFDPAKTRDKSVRIKCGKCASTFTFTVPETALLGTPSPSSRGGVEPPSPPARRKTILVVDDARFFRELIVDVLAPLSCTVLTAGDGDEALETVRRERPSLVILDLNLPGLDGFGLMKAIRLQPELGGIHLLAMSAVFREEADVSQALEAGADDFVPKSFRPDQLLARVRRLLDKS